jgi:hypothetical protein
MRKRLLFLAVLSLAVLLPTVGAPGKENLQKRHTYELRGVVLDGGKLVVKAKGRTPGG